MIPMPMNAARLAEYVRIYDVDLDHSLVAVTRDGQMLGVAMLGRSQKPCLAHAPRCYSKDTP